MRSAIKNTWKNSSSANPPCEPSDIRSAQVHFPSNFAKRPSQDHGPDSTPKRRRAHEPPTGSTLDEVVTAQNSRPPPSPSIPTPPPEAIFHHVLQQNVIIGVQQDQDVLSILAPLLQHLKEPIDFDQHFVSFIVSLGAEEDVQRLCLAIDACLRSRGDDTPMVYIRGTTTRDEMQQISHPDKKGYILCCISVETLGLFLHREYLKLSDMEYLFIINQAEQIDENHVVAQLLRRYYTSLTVSARPRIVVTQTTTSAQISYEHLLAMEDVVHASVWGMPDDARSQTTPGFTKPTEVVILYEQETYNDAEWSLLTDLEKLEGPSQRLVKEIAGARRVRQELGLAALDLFWRRRIDSWSVLPQGDNLDAALLDKIKSQVKGGALKPLVIDPATEGFNVSSKFVRLYDIVLQFEIDKANFRGLIFVATKLLAGALMDTLRALLSVSAWLKPHILLDDTASTDKIVKDFREGRVNLLICNSAAEDSLELPPASCAIYWDLPSNYVSYSCLKAKLDPEFGHAILLCEKGNDQHRRFVLGLSTPRPTWARWIKNMDNSSRNVPPIDMLEENAINGPDEGDIDNTDEDPILDPVTGVRLRPTDFLVALSKYFYRTTDSLPPRSIPPLCTYSVVNGFPPMVVCNLSIPIGCHFRTISSPPCLSRADARRQATSRAFRELFRLRLLDPSLFRPPPPIHRTAPPLEAEDVESPAAGQNSTVAVKSAGARKRSERSGCTFYYRRRAGFWLRSLDAPHGRLYPTVVTLESQVPAVGDEVVPLRRSLCILARLPLPSFPSFRVYGTKGSQTVQLRRCAEVRVSDEELQAIYRFTTLLYQTVTARRCESTIERCGCFVVPLLPSWPDVLKYALEQDSWPFPPVTGHIAWDEIRRLEERPMTPVQGPNCSEELRDILLLDRPSTKLYEILEVCSGLGPLSKVGGTGVEADYANLLEYYQAVRPEPIVLQSGDQNILLVKPMPSAFNQLKPDIKDLDTGPDDPRKYPRYVIPELCMKHPIAARQVPEQYSLMNLVTMIVPISVLRTALVLPSILSRIDSYLVLKEFNALTLENRLQDADLLEAMTPLAAMMDVNYERLELLGDAFLKHLASIYLIVTHPDGTEKELHTLRTVIIRNATLLEIANRNSIPEFIQSKPPTMRSWLPPGFWVPGGRKVSVPPVETKGRVESANEDDMSDLDGEELVEEEDGEGVVEADSNVILTEPQESHYNTTEASARHRNKPARRYRHHLGNKLVADVCEALMGVSFLRSGEDGALQLCKKIGLPIPLVDRWDDFARKTVIPPLPPNLLPSARQKLAVEKIIGCAFAKPELLGQALTHSTASTGYYQTYERYEFLGDAVLDFLVVQYLFHTYEDFGPDNLTTLKSALVSRGPLSALCIETGLADFLRVNSPTLTDEVKKYREELQRARKAEMEAAKKQKRPLKEYWFGTDAPKVLSDLVEAIFGALLISDDFRLTAVQTMFDTLVKPFFEKYIRLDTLAKHPMAVLVQWFQERCRDFKVTTKECRKRDGDHYTCIIECHGQRLSKATHCVPAQASYHASKKAQEVLKDDPDFMGRVCNCQEAKEEREAKKKRAAENRKEEIRLRRERELQDEQDAVEELV